jgi:hypothetical protein
MDLGCHYNLPPCPTVSGQCLPVCYLHYVAFLFIFPSFTRIFKLWLLPSEINFGKMRTFYSMEDKINKPEFNNGVINYCENYNSISVTDDGYKNF